MSKDIRDAFFDYICECAFQDENVVIITDDMDIFSLQRFKKHHPERYFNPGVAEQQVINLAAGMASSGKKVIVCGIASFITLRCLEQIKVNICSMGLPVVVVGLGVGLSFSFDGPTHHGVSDIAAMRSLPEINILNPIDEYSAAAAAEIAYKSNEPCYVRIDKGVMNNVYDSSELSTLKGYTEILPVSDFNILSTGRITHLLCEIASGFGLLDVYRVKPLNSQFILELATRSRGLITVEEHMSGGLFSMVSELLSRHDVFKPVKGIGLNDGQYLEYGSREWLCDSNGLSRAEIIQKMNAFKEVIGRFND